MNHLIMFVFNNKNLGKSYGSKKNAIDVEIQPESSGIEKTLFKIFFNKILCIYMKYLDKGVKYVHI